MIHPSVRELLASMPEATSAVAVIRERARGLVQRARALGWDGPPFDTFALAEILGIEIDKVADLGERDALIVADDQGQVRILLSDAAPVVRQRFSVGHEVAHTFFPDVFEHVRYRSGSRKPFDPDEEVEQLCNIGAAELLLPFVPFAGDAAAAGFSVSGVIDLAARYHASKEAVVRRMADVSKEAHAAVFLSLRNKPTEERAAVSAPPKLRVDSIAHSETFVPHLLPIHKSVPDDSCVYDAASQGDVVSAVEVWQCARNKRVQFHVDAIRLGDTIDGSPKVLALLTPVVR